HSFPTRRSSDLEVARIFVPEFIRIRWDEIGRELQNRETALAYAAGQAVARGERLDTVWGALGGGGLPRARRGAPAARAAVGRYQSLLTLMGINAAYIRFKLTKKLA